MKPRIGVAAMEEGKKPLRFLQFFLPFLLLGLGFLILTINTFRYFGVLNVGPIVKKTIITTLPCFEEEKNSLEKWIQPPLNLMHNMNDTELLWRASFVPGIKDYPFHRVGKIAFMFLTKGPLPLAPLWERFFKGHSALYSIYVHALPSYVAEYPPSSVFYKRQIPSQMTEWGMMSMCDAERRLVANALLDISNEWFILVSESCIPLHNFTTIYRYISESHYSFVGSFDDPGPFGRGRYHWAMAPEVKLEDWRKGSQWFEVNRELAVKMIQDTVYYLKFRDFCRPACYVDEHYFQTMLSIQTPHLLANRSLTLIDWSRGGAHPATFGKDDIKDDFFKRFAYDTATCSYNNQSTTLCFLFVRKVAPNALDPLLVLASKELGF